LSKASPLLLDGTVQSDGTIGSHLGPMTALGSPNAPKVISGVAVGALIEPAGGLGTSRRLTASGAALRAPHGP
jgi:hypothetical protein